jgi:tRNA(Arg) A34 adenosine deaminase TadA
MALDEARAAAVHDDVPVGAVVVRGGEVIAARHNERELTGDPTAHAEVLALRDAAAAVGHWRLDECTLVVTLEPCAMCAGAIVNARLGRSCTGQATRRPVRPAAASTSSTSAAQPSCAPAHRACSRTSAEHSWSSSSWSDGGQRFRRPSMRRWRADRRSSTSRRSDGSGGANGDASAPRRSTGIVNGSCGS